MASFCRSWRIWRFTSASRWYTSAFFPEELFSGAATALQPRDGIQIAGQLFLHPRYAILIELLGYRQGLHIRQSRIQHLSFLFPHIEDGALLCQAGQRILRASEKRRHVLRRSNVVIPQEIELLPVSLRLCCGLPELGRHAGRILPLPSLAQ